MPVIVEPDREDVAVLLVLERLERHRPFSARVEVISQELRRQRVSVLARTRQACIDRRARRTFSHLNTMSTSLSVRGFMSLEMSDSGGMSRPSMTFRISFHTRVMTISFVASLKYVLNVGRIASR